MARSRVLLLALACGAIGTAAASAEPLDAAAIGKAAGVEARALPDGVVRIGRARTDVAVTVDGTPLDPAAGLGSWAAFEAAPGGAMMMGDTVVFEDEITPALDVRPWPPASRSARSTTTSSSTARASSSCTSEGTAIPRPSPRA